MSTPHGDDTLLLDRDPRAAPRDVASDDGRAVESPEPDAEDLFAGPPSLRASVRVETQAWHDAGPLAIADRALHAIAAHDGIAFGAAEFDILFTSDEVLAELNGAYRGKNAPTNVLSFPVDGAETDGQGFLGGIALADGVCAREAAERGLSFADHATHLALHGVLHLLGFDHEEEGAAATMERLEVEILSTLGIANPYEGA